ncbi:hypothetical protein [Cohnella abietis]|uniref:hypothetical protein n=1 Tax=Cohnella abietis TaxID=2507935 RepID=UPI00102E9CEA|nr:hypothetical protein [Cohnella abietis]
MYAYLCSIVWLIGVFSYLSDYTWYRLIATGTWGFIFVNAVTLFPVLLFLFIADRLQPIEKHKKRTAE